MENKNNKIKNWLDDSENIALLLVLFFAFAVRFYYFFILAPNQPLWWDELVSGSLAKNMISHAWAGTQFIEYETLIRPFLFPFLWSLLLRIDLPEIGSRILLEFIPSILAVLFIYLAGKEAFNKRVGILAAFIFSTLWIHVFYTLRFLTDIPALPLLFLSVYYFIKSTKSSFIPKYFAISLFLLSFCTLLRYQNGLVFFAYLIFLLLTEKLTLLKERGFWIAGIAGVIPLLIFFGYNQINSGNIFPALLGGDYVQSTAKPFAFNVLNFVPIYLTTPFLILFIVGLGSALLQLFLGYDTIRKNSQLKSHLIFLLIAVVIYSYFIFYLRIIEDRWLFSTSLPLAYFSAFGLESISKKIKKYGNIISIFFILVFLMAGAYSQYGIADPLIKEKKDSYLQMRTAFLWIKDNTPQNSVILGQSVEPYSVYYADRRFESLPKNITQVDSISADYLVVHAFIQQPEYLGEYLQSRQDKWQPIQVFFFDVKQTQPAVVIYKNTEVQLSNLPQQTTN